MVFGNCMTTLIFRGLADQVVARVWHYLKATGFDREAAPATKGVIGDAGERADRKSSIAARRASLLVLTELSFVKSIFLTR